MVAPLTRFRRAVRLHRRYVKSPAEPQAREALLRVLLDLGVEPSMTVNEAEVILRWSYRKARSYFSQVEGICVSYRPKRYKRPYRTFTIPECVRLGMAEDDGP